MPTQEEITSIQQSYGLLTKAKNILIALPQDPSTDAIASGLALYLMLQKLEKNVKVVASNFELPPSHHFLAKSKEITSDLTQLRKFVISVDTKSAPVEELSYDMTGDLLQIYITPKKGFFSDKDITTSAGNYTYDCIIVLDAPSLPSLGKVFEDNADFFYQTPVINIDHHASNEQFGQINIVDLVATSVSEIVFEILREFGHNVLDEQIATNLLAGIIAKTKSFRSLSATPKSLNIASHLIAQGARREEIINNLYRTKSLNVIQLWGRALARLKTAFEGMVVYSKLGLSDFERSNTTELDLPGILDEIMVNAEGAEIGFVSYEHQDGSVGIILSTLKSHNSLEILKPLEPTGNHNLAKAKTVGALAEVEQNLLDIIGNYLLKVR